MKVRFHGITDERSQCDHCGRTGLKKTVMLFILDGDGNAEELTYYGTSCAANALGVTSASVKRDAERAENSRQKRIKDLEYILSLPDITGRTLHHVRRAWNQNVRTNSITHKMTGSITVDGVTYGPNEGEGRGFIAFARAQEGSFREELAALLKG